MLTFFRGLLLLCAIVFGGCTAAKRAEKNIGFITYNGEPRAEIIVSEQASRSTQLAAKELQFHIEKISGAKLPISTRPSNLFPIKICIGKSRFTSTVDAPVNHFTEGQFLVKTTATNLFLLGKDDNFEPKEPYGHDRGDGERATLDWQKLTNSTWENPCAPLFKSYSSNLNIWEQDGRGTLNAVYHFLHELGVNWYLPGELGAILPIVKNIPLNKFDENVKPSFPVRILNFSAKRFF